MYNVVLTLHNIVRWVIILSGIAATIRGVVGWFRKLEWTDAERRIGIVFTMSVDLQLLLGILLYFVFSDWALKAILDKGMSFVMGTSEYRFFAIEHGFYMLVGIVSAHLGNALPKKVADSDKKFKRAALWFGIATFLILIGTPWSRPLFPGF